MWPADDATPIEPALVARRTQNPIRNIVDQLKVQPHPEKPMISLALGDPTLHGNFRAPLETGVKELERQLQSFQFNGYPPSAGYEQARDAIARYYAAKDQTPLTASDVVICSGCSGALDLCVTVLADEGQNILMPRPGFSLYQTLAMSKGIECRYYDLLPDKNWEIDLAHLESLVDGRTAAIVVNNPSNPCGSVYSREHLLAILRVAEKTRVPIIADEIYADMAFRPHRFYPLASLTETVPVLAVGGLAKRYLVPGWRVGWVLVHDRRGLFTEVRKGLLALSQLILGANSLVQSIIPKLLHETPASFYEETLKQLEDNAKLSADVISQIPGLQVIVPQGAMYMMVGIKLEEFKDIKSDLDFTERLVAEESVLCLPGQCFQYPNFFRIVITSPRDKLQTAYDRIRAFCARHHK